MAPLVAGQRGRARHDLRVGFEMLVLRFLGLFILAVWFVALIGHLFAMAPRLHVAVGLTVGVLLVPVPRSA